MNKTDKERFFEKALEKGLEPSIIGNTVQWTNPSWTVINYFNEKGEYVKTERS
jgi:hypothetical protein